ncbi:hypothetical protein E6P09_13470 [Haloferax mediterranei ATCC 33500]|uniref:Uncharacterized protein n=1 Tax=Haloferax mediterranei (strain ATCC 33500 / DSM 1411 / JCM 8866 / NBRC 14739 / NCIMB 2177 / R-4) TaxID=523841 RepID=I3R7X7_HALMT|nr:hypothetical protein [Haloferax mediterranei]AFK20337.1 hypothetical protein HFX_2659 [Haloferax mediterranei ATCC 33500]AHZ23705.1 hypothetical protein BM92_14110 [Haloferax mediterranei ATCC 33500]ELZ99193.1 hypothetical protein C439_15079 [Haloferax mediterranei ATCC 33500]MDX5986907.1 hypothetical protein [Haloferax mediterranei ATCC 33500]QCQ76229.1 hypothetical protein E6P09_13470 [Haloferax mediterranei ATCC 33500]
MASNGGPSSGEPDDTMRDRGAASRAKLRIYLGADRRLVATAPLVVVFLSIVVLGVLDPSPLESAVEASDPIETLAQGLLTAIITGVTLVVSINQLVLSRELGPLGEQRDRIQGSIAFREDVADLLDAPVAPPEPSAFLRALAESIAARARTVEETVSGDRAPETDAAARVREFASEVEGNAEAVAERLEGRQFGTFGVLSAALDLNYSWKMYQATRLRRVYEDDLPDETRAALSDLRDALELFGPAREHVKTLYFRWELVNLSRSMFYTAVPALVVSVGSILFLNDLSTVTGATLGVSNLLLVVAFVTAISLAPFSVLAAAVLRISTVAKRTLSIGPFVLRSETREEDLDWES